MVVDKDEVVRLETTNTLPCAIEKNPLFMITVEPVRVEATVMVTRFIVFPERDDMLPEPIVMVERVAVEVVMVFPIRDDVTIPFKYTLEPIKLERVIVLP